jgi:hypothetical protein
LVWPTRLQGNDRSCKKIIVFPDYNHPCVEMSIFPGLSLFYIRILERKTESNTPSALIKLHSLSFSLSVRQEKNVNTVFQ